MSAPIRSSVVVVAAGRGERCGGAPKQFRRLRDRPLLLHSVDALVHLPGLTELIVVLPSEAPSPPEVETGLRRLAEDYPAVAFGTAPGGPRRQDSVAAGLEALTRACDVILVHDAARPFPPIEPTGRAIEKAAEGGGAILAVRATETLKRADDQGRILETVGREAIWLAQTPQAFRAEYREGLVRWLKSSQVLTDEASALEKLGVPVVLVEGSALNLKVTTEADFKTAEREAGRPPQSSD